MVDLVLRVAEGRHGSHGTSGRPTRWNMTIQAIELRVVRMPLVRPFATSQGVTHERDVLLAHVMGDAEGWGECNQETSAIEMAKLDAELKLAGVSLAHHLGGRRAAIDSTATVGFEDDVDEFLACGYR